MSNFGRSNVKTDLDKLCHNLRLDLQTLESTKVILEAALLDVKMAERQVRGLGLREASLSAKQTSAKLEDIFQLQSETNGAFRQLQRQFEGLCQRLESTKAEITSLETQISTAYGRI